MLLEPLTVRISVVYTIFNEIGLSFGLSVRHGGLSGHFGPTSNFQLVTDIFVIFSKKLQYVGFGGI